MKHWYVCKTKAGDEGRAERNLLSQGYDTYLPLVLKHKSKRRYPQSITEPMFPGYLFINLDPEEDNFRPIDSTRGVSGLVKFGHNIIPVQEGVIENLKEMETDQGIHKPYETEYREGETVRITEGAFKLYKGTIEAVRGNLLHLILQDKNVPIVVSYKKVESL